VKLDKAPWSARKLGRKSLKQFLWVTFALWTGFTFVGFFTPIHMLAGEVLTFTLGPWETFWILFYGFATYGNAGYLREQVCKYMCPYARFQSAMFDRDTLVVSYDARRGDPRGTRGRDADARALGLGDCIDCGLCVQVCPTGIDIRQGLQYACIGCAACVDVCNGVMDKMRYRRGLIRFATQSALAAPGAAGLTLKRMLRPRVLVYGAVLLALCAGFLGSLWLRSPFRVDVVRDRGALARELGHGEIENVYRLQVMNATEDRQRYRVGVEGLDGAALATRADFSLGPAEARWLPVGVRLAAEPAQALKAGAHPLRFRIERIEGDGPTAVVREPSTFVVPR
jgi:cytochrome c oxidase accessory protein FixG